MSFSDSSDSSNTSPIEREYAEESRTDAKDGDWTSGSEDGANDDPLPPTYTPPTTRAQDAPAQPETEAGPSEPGFWVSSPPVRNENLIPCKPCLRRMETHFDHVCIGRPGFRACVWCCEQHRGCRRIPDMFHAPVRAALQLEGEDRKQALSTIRQDPRF
ncbi:unnamed protein product [Penicillium bialowiezense]